MEVVLGSRNLQLGVGNAYLLTLAEQLQRLGYGVTVHALEGGPVDTVASDRGIRVTTGRDQLPEACDAALTQDTLTALNLAETYPDVRQVYVCHGAPMDVDSVPSLPDLIEAVVVMSDRVRRRVEAASLEHEVVRLRQPVDLERFMPRGVRRDSPRTALLLGHGERDAMVREACAAAGLAAEHIGMHGAGDGTPPEVALAESDIVIGSGRSIVEAMASGRATYVLGDAGGDGWITPGSYEAIEADGFRGSATAAVIDGERLRLDLAAYRPGMGLANRDLACRHHDAATHGEQIASLLKRAAPRSDSVPDDLFELERLVRMQWQTHSRAELFAHENERLRQRLDELEYLRNHAAETERRLRALTSTRRFRAMRSLMRPLDALRGRR